jgi:hypothetical protein
MGRQLSNNTRLHAIRNSHKNMDMDRYFEADHGGKWCGMDRSILDMAGAGEVGRGFLGNKQRSGWTSGLLCYSNIAALWSAAWVSNIIL